MAAACDADLAHLDAGMAHRIMQKRQMELVRRQRLLNARHRTIGLDTEGLAEQVAEKRDEFNNTLVEKDADKTNAAYLDTICVLQERDAKAEKLQLEKEHRDYSLKFLRREQRKEYKLSDPDQLKREHAMTEEEAAQLGASSICLFEDKNAARRKAATQAHLKEYLTMQIEEKRQTQAAEAEMEADYAHNERQSNEVRQAIEQEMAAQRSQDAWDNRNYNLDLAVTHADRKASREAAHDAAKESEIAYNRGSQLLNEAEFLRGPDGRVLPDTFKRMSQEQVQAILDEQAYQMIEKRQKAEVERQDDIAYAQQLELQRQCIDAVEQEKQRRLGNKRAAYARQFKEDARSKAAQIAEDGKLYQNAVGADFFDQFGRTAR